MSESVLSEEIELRVDYGLASTFEVDIEPVVAATPPALTPVEVRPGVGLASLVYFRFADGNLHAEHGPQPAYHELVFGVHVTPHLTWGLPRFAIFVINIGVDVPAVGGFLRQVHRMPTHPTPLRFAVEDDPMRVEISDDDGPIAVMKNLHPAPAFAPDALPAHVFSLDEGRLWGYPETMHGPMLRHQTRGRAVALARHAFFRGAELPREPQSYMQVVGQPGGVTRQVAHRAMAVRAGR
jgi:hypothetical protein